MAHLIAAPPRPPTPLALVVLGLLLWAAPAPAAADRVVEVSQPVLTRTETREPPAPRRLVLPTLDGSIGLLRVGTADTGEPRWLRLGFFGQYAASDDFLVAGDQNRRLGGTLVAGYAPLANLDLQAALLATGNRNRRCIVPAEGGPCLADAGRRDPVLIRSLGDLSLGARLAGPVGRWLRLGLQAGVRLFAGADSFDLDGDATSGFVRALGSFQPGDGAAMPVRVHVNLGYWLDNSWRLDELRPFGADALESRLVTSYAYGINRDRATAAVGLSAPLVLATGGLAIEPFAEYHVELVVDDPDPLLAAADSANRDQHWTSLGLRLQGAGGLAVSVAVDIAVRPAGFAYTPWLAPWNLLVGIAHPFDLGPPRTRVVSHTYTVTRSIDRTPPPREGWVAGSIVDAATKQPIPGALVDARGSAPEPVGRVASDRDGRFATKALRPGPVELDIRSAGYEPQTVKARVVVGQTSPIEVALVAQPQPVVVLAQISSERDGRPVALAAVRITGPVEVAGETDRAGLFVATLPPGAYAATITPAGGRPHQHPFVVGPVPPGDSGAEAGGAMAPGSPQKVLIALPRR